MNNIKKIEEVIKAQMTGKKEMQYLSQCPICGEPIYPLPADHDGHYHIVHKTSKEQIKELEQRVASLEGMMEVEDAEA